MNFAAQKTAPQLISRLREIERIQIRAASTPAALEHLRQNNFASDFVTPETMQEVKDAIDLEFAEFDRTKWWQTQTWKI